MGKSLFKYGLTWHDASPLAIEMECIRRGGSWVSKKTGTKCGAGLAEHYLRMQRLLWPTERFHKWKELQLSEMVEQRILGIMGSASSGKTHEAALYALCTFYCFPNETTILCSSTTREMLEMRIWGEIKKYHLLAQALEPELPGKLLESRQRIITTDEEAEGRDFRNGMCAVPCKPGGTYVGLGDYVGVKNKRLLLVADEAQFMPGGFVDSISNLNKNPIFQCFALGNPKDRTDALGRICEPEAGWDSVDDTEKTKTWKTRFNGGRCIQLVGTDSPNFDSDPNIPPPFPFLITRQAIDDDAKFYGRESLQFSMMNLGMMPKETMSRRVITRSLVNQFSAMAEPVWAGSKLTDLGCLDASYSSVGGDRTVFIPLKFGECVDGKMRLAVAGPPEVVKTTISGGLVEDQIAIRTKELCEARGIEPEHFFFDSTGRGSLALAYARLWSNAVVGVEFGGPATDRPVAEGFVDPQTGRAKTCRQHYSKFVTELWYSVRLIVEADQFRGMTEDILMEGCMREWMMVSGNRIEVEDKKKTKIRMGRSPDIFDALVAGVEGARRLGFQITKLRNTSDRGKTREWLDKLKEKAEKLIKHRQLAYR